MESFYENFDVSQKFSLQTDLELQQNSIHKFDLDNLILLFNSSFFLLWLKFFYQFQNLNNNNFKMFKIKVFKRVQKKLFLDNTIDKNRSLMAIEFV